MAKQNFYCSAWFIFLTIVLVTTVTSEVNQRDEYIYQDVLAEGWTNWSWSTDVLFNVEDPVYQGEHSMSVTHNSDWAGLYLHTENHLVSSNYSDIQFYIHGGSTGAHQLSVTLYDGTMSAGTSVSITSEPATWTPVRISIADLGTPQEISGLVIQDASGASQPAYYIDSIHFVAHTGTPTPTPTAGPGPALHVDVTTGYHLINDLIYGMNFADNDLALELQLPVNRWGGNSTTRYNWETDTSNRASDWYFENIPNSNPNPELLPDGSASDRFHEANLVSGAASLLTIPMIGWTPAARQFECGFRVSIYGDQQSTDPWAPDCGNGVDTSGQEITGNDPLETSIQIDDAFVTDWIAHLTAKYGTAAQGGVKFYNLDNEPMLWNSTHRDVFPAPASYDELKTRIIQYGTAVKAADSSAETLGPVTWGWTAYFYSALDWEPGGSWWLNPLDRNAHGGEAFTPWLLDQLQSHETNTGVRVMDYLDLHYYPQAPGVSLSGAGNRATQELRMRATRSLWDATYTDESWIGEPVRLLPRMEQWITANYPGIKRAITEYNFGGLEHINGAVAQAEVLGVFGREGLDFACLWDAPDNDQPGAYAFRMFRNYDGQGSRFGSNGVFSSSTEPNQLSVFAALDNEMTMLTIIVINKSFLDTDSSLQILGISSISNVEGFRYSDSNLDQIESLGAVPINDSMIQMVYPAQSITLFEMGFGMCVNHGDVNSDGHLSAADAQKAFEIVLGLLSPTPEQACAADCNADESVTASDAQQIFLAVLGVTTCVDSLPV